MKKESSSFNGAALVLCGIFLVVHIFQQFSSVPLGFTPAEPTWWQFFTSFVAHGGPEHLFNNMFFIGLFGTIYELLTSSEKVYGTFILAAVVANLSSFIFFPDSTVIGASGGAFGILAALAVYRPHKPGLALGVPLPMWAVLFIYTVIDLAGLGTATNIAHEAHLVGIAIGAFIGLQLRGSKKDGRHKGGGYGKKAETRSQKEKVNADEKEWRRKIREWEDKYMLN